MYYIHIHTGLRIDSQQYSKLSYDDKFLFLPENTSSNRDIVDTIVDVGVGIVIGSAINSFFDDSSSSSSNYDSSSSSDSSGFDGGFGGGIIVEVDQMENGK